MFSLKENEKFKKRKVFEAKRKRKGKTKKMLNNLHKYL